MSAPVLVGTETRSSGADEASRYTRRSILRSERMYGRGFQSPNHPGAMDTFCAVAGLREDRPGARVLDVGSGLGGAAFHFVQRYGATVVGLDVAPAMVELATERAAEASIDGVTFIHGDVRHVPLDAASFDLIWTRDCILYLPEKLPVWRRLLEALAPGGRLFVTDFCRGAGKSTPDFEGYLADCHYTLQTIPAYAATLKDAGFTDVVSQDLTAEFAETLRQEETELLAGREAFVAEFGEADLEYLTSRWDKKRRFCDQGALAWGLFTAGNR